MSETGQNLTRNQSLVLTVLSSSGIPLSAYTILDELRPEGLRAPLQVYRALDKLMESGLVHRIESANAFVACAHPSEHSGETLIFMLCETCGKAEEFTDNGLADCLDGLCKKKKFHSQQRTVEVRGACADCAN